MLMPRSLWRCVPPLVILATLATAAKPATLLVEAEAFQLHGDWQMENLHTCSGRALLKTSGAKGDAMTAIEVPETATYNVWARAMDFAKEQPGSRRYTITLDDQPFEEDAGDHGQNGWYWQKLGERQLDAGEHLLGLRDVTHFFGRCDAVFLTTDDTDPNNLSLTQIAKFRITPKTVPVVRTRKFPQAPTVAVDVMKQAAQLANDHVRVTFLTGKDGPGKPRAVRRMEVKSNDQWIELPLDPNRETLFLLFSEKSGLNARSFFPSWSASKDLIELKVGGKLYRTSAGQKNPFWAGEPTVLVPRSVKQVDAQHVRVSYESEDGRMAEAIWELGADRRDLHFEVSTVVAQPGDYSFGYTAFHAWEPEQVDFNLLVPLFQYQRRPMGVSMITSAVTPHPLVLVQAPLPGPEQRMSFALVADPTRLPFDWAEPENGKYGFALLNYDEKVQPTIFQPVMGGVGSRLEAGDTLTASWHVLVTPGDWKQALAYESSTIMGVTDYRQPVRTSLSDAALNLIDLMKHDFASGWDADLKGFYNIETISVVTQAAPLAVLEAAVLTRNEQLYAQRALPTLEYILTRPSAHFAVAVPDTHAPYVNDKSIQLQLPSDFYGTAFWQGAHALLGEANPWLADLAMDKGDVRYRATYSGMPRWSELLAAYRLDPTPQRLEQARTEADAWIDREIFGKHDDYLGVRPFYNMSFYPYWWDLIDLYELTGDTRHLEAAREAAYHTVAGLWTHPMYPDQTTIHPGGQFTGNDHLWWRDDQEYRLGYPRKPNDTPEKTVPGWVVSGIGLGLEQPSTYFGGGTGKFQQIMMSSWAPNLLRLFQLTGDDTLRTAARNTIIGRYANYPGYYLRGFTDMMQDPRYPYDGPDVTSVYYHHIPPQLAFTLDYLVTDVQLRSKNAIRFPWVKQQGYVWFTNRIYGSEPGQVFGDPKVVLRLDRVAAHVDSPKVNVLLGRGEDRAYVMLTNDAQDDAAVSVSLNADRLKLQKGQPIRVLDADGMLIAEHPFSQKLDITVPVRGLVVLSLAADHEEINAALPPVRNGRIDRAMPGDWKDMHAFRIRSPFAKDSLYLVLMGRPAEGAVAELTVRAGHEEHTLRDDRFPYEFSLYPLPMAEDISLGLTLRNPDGERILSEAFTLPGSPEATSTAPKMSNANQIIHHAK